MFQDELIVPATQTLSAWFPDEKGGTLIPDGGWPFGEQSGGDEEEPQ